MTIKMMSLLCSLEMQGIGYRAVHLHLVVHLFHLGIVLCASTVEEVILVQSATEGLGLVLVVAR